MPTYNELLATKPLPLLPQPAPRYPGPIQRALARAMHADRMIAYYQSIFEDAQSAIDEATHATPTNPS